MAIRRRLWFLAIIASAVLIAVYLHRDPPQLARPEPPVPSTAELASLRNEPAEPAALTDEAQRYELPPTADAVDPPATESGGELEPQEPDPAHQRIARALARGIEVDVKLAPATIAQIDAILQRTEEGLREAREAVDRERDRVIRERIEHGKYMRLEPTSAGNFNAGGTRGKFLVHMTFLPDATPISITLDHGEEPTLEDLNRFVGGILEGREREILEVLGTSR